MTADLEEPVILISEKKVSLDAGHPAAPRAGRARRSPARSSSPRTSRARRSPRSSSTSSAASSRSCAVKAPGFGDRRKEMLKDIAILTGGQVVSEDLGIKLDSVTPEGPRHAPSASRSTRTTRPSSTAPATPKEIKGRVEAIRKQIENTTSDYDKEKLQERLAKLAGGVAVVKVGAHTETEMKEKKARVEDALHATRAAVEEGIVPGGGVALLRAASGARRAQGRRATQQSGVDLVRRAIEEPLRQIAQQRRRRRLRRRREGPRGQGRLRLQRADRHVRGPAQGRRHRPGEGRPHRPSSTRPASRA